MITPGPSPIRKLAPVLGGGWAQKGYSSPYSVAVLYPGLGDKDAIQWLTTAYQERDINLERLKTDPLLDRSAPTRAFPNWKKRSGCLRVTTSEVGVHGSRRWMPAKPLKLRPECNKQNHVT